MTKELLTPKQIAAEYGIGQHMLRAYRKRREGPPFYRLSGRSYRFDRAEFEAWFRTRRTTPSD